MPSVRSFIALEFGSEAKAEFARIIELLKKSGADAKWQDPKSIHLTLKFLGSVDESKIPVISRELQNISKDERPFNITLKGLGAFPGFDRPRVVWIGLAENEGTTALKRLAGGIENLMSNLGFAKEIRDFSPHITLGRIKSQKNIGKLKEAAQKIEVIPVIVPISSLVLFKSDLTPEGAIHTIISSHIFS